MKYAVLCTSGKANDWPDRLDPRTGQFFYYGDNRKPGHKLHETRRGGNKILRRAFHAIHADPPRRELVPPFFVFQSHPTARSSRAFQFRGLAVPGYLGHSQVSDLIAIWKVTNGHRFQNYRATFTILKAAEITRGWIDDLKEGVISSTNAPRVWREWIETGKYNPLTAESTTVTRAKDAQLPNAPNQLDILEVVWKYFKDDSRSFELFAARLFQMHEPKAVIDKITRRSVDGGRDAIGRYRLGVIDDPIYVDFSLEAKCFRPPINGMTGTTVGVKHTARLISRIRNRQFGVLVTTSVIGDTAYKEVRKDGHPIVFISGKDIAEILIKNGFSSPELVSSFLETEFAG